MTAETQQIEALAASGKGVLEIIGLVITGMGVTRPEAHAMVKEACPQFFYSTDSNFGRQQAADCASLRAAARKVGIA